MTLQGNVPAVFMWASMAFTWRYSWPLSSTEPRAKSFPSRTSGSNGGESQRSSGSTGWTS